VSCGTYDYFLIVCIVDYDSPLSSYKIHSVSTVQCPGAHCTALALNNTNTK